MLHLGMVKMWQRYPLAVVVSYGVFLLLLKLWIIYQERSLTQDLLDASNLDPSSFLPDGGSSSSVARTGRFPWMDRPPPIWTGTNGLAIDCCSARRGRGRGRLGFHRVGCTGVAWVRYFLDAVVIAGLRKKMISCSRAALDLGSRSQNRSSLRGGRSGFLVWLVA
jgi:hypothetical protein